MLCDDLRYTAAGFGPSGGKLAGCSMWPLRGWRCRHSSSGLWAPTMRLFLSLGVAGGLALFLLLSCLCRSATLRVGCSLTKHACMASMVAPLRCLYLLTQGSVAARRYMLALRCSNALFTVQVEERYRFSLKGNNSSTVAGAAL